MALMLGTGGYLGISAHGESEPFPAGDTRTPWSETAFEGASKPSSHGD